MGGSACPGSFGCRKGVVPPCLSSFGGVIFEISCPLVAISLFPLSLSLFLKGENCKQSVIKSHLQAHVGLLMIIIIMNKLSSLRMRSSVTFHRNN